MQQLCRPAIRAYFPGHITLYVCDGLGSTAVMLKQVAWYRGEMAICSSSSQIGRGGSDCRRAELFALPQSPGPSSEP